MAICNKCGGSAFTPEYHDDCEFWYSDPTVFDAEAHEIRRQLDARTGEYTLGCGCVGCDVNLPVVDGLHGPNFPCWLGK